MTNFGDHLLAKTSSPISYSVSWTAFPDLPHLRHDVSDSSSMSISYDKRVMSALGVVSRPINTWDDIEVSFPFSPSQRRNVMSSKSFTLVRRVTDELCFELVCITGQSVGFGSIPCDVDEVDRPIAAVQKNLILNRETESCMISWLCKMMLIIRTMEQVKHD